jgi:hypothetical protein
MRIGKVDNFFRGCHVVCLVGIVLLIGLCFLAKRAFDTPEADFTTAPLSLSEFYNRSGRAGGLPVTAMNLYYASAHRGHGFVSMYRFDAPAADCIAYGRQLLEQRGAPKDAGLVALTASPDPLGKLGLDAMGLSKVDWFDVETIRSGFVGHQEPSTQPGMRLWIDTDRGRFYFYSSD